MTHNPPSSRPPVRPVLAIGAPVILAFMACYQFAYAVKHSEHAQLLHIMGWSLAASAVALAVTVAVANLLWMRRRRFTSAGASDHLEP